MNTLIKSDKYIFSVGPEISFYNTKEPSLYNSIKNWDASNVFGSNLGLAFKYRKQTSKKLFFQSTLIFEPIRFQLQKGNFKNINIFKREISPENFNKAWEGLSNCPNCNLIQLKISTGVKL
jgi:hypothetical protein